MAVVTYGLIIAFSAGTLILALSALSRNSRYVALLWLGLWFVSSVVSSVLDGVHHQQIRYAFYAQLRAQQPEKFNPGLSPKQRREKWLAGQLARQSVWEQYHAAHLRDSRTDWRPLVSYTANLNRLEDHLLGTNNAWRNLAKLEPGAARRNRLLSRYMGPQFPWYWSAAVLAALFGLSLCLLSLSIRSLDRLK